MSDLTQSTQPPESQAGVELRDTLFAATQALKDGETLKPFTRLGPYQIDSLLGRGGMGVVYRVLQMEPVRRLVALKLVRGESSSIAQAFFEVERQALAQMSHPAIAKVFDAGALPNGELYFAMEYIDGVPLDEYVRSQQYSLQDLVRLFINIAFGVHHAHGKSVIHRDLKPGNVLVHQVDGRAHPKIIDFGVAVASDSKGAAKVRDQAGTLAYMAPEQLNINAEGIDRRVDVFALGAMFAEMLCINHQLQLGRANATRLREVFARTDTRLSQRFSGEADAKNAIDAKAIAAAKRIPRELRAVALMAIATDREARYDSAEAFARDLQAYLAKRPVRAMRGGRLYALGKFASRNRLAVGAGIALSLSLLLGVASTIYGLRQAERALAKAEVQAQSAVKTANFLGDILAGVSPDQARSLDRTLLREMLDKAATKAQTELAGSPDVLRNIESVIARSYGTLSEYEQSLKHADLALAQFPSTLTAEQKRERLALMLSRNTALSMFKNPAAALANARDVKAQAIAEFGADSESALSAGNDETWFLFLSGDLQGADKLGTELRLRSEKILGPKHDLSVAALQNLAVVRTEVGQLTEAEALLKELVQRQTERFGADHSRTIGAKQSLSVNYLQQRRYADAEAILKAMLPALEANFGPTHAATINAYANLAGALRQGGKLKESEHYYRQALETALKKYGPDNDTSVQLAINLANFETAAGRPADALKRLAELAPLVEKRFPGAHQVRIEALRTQARAHVALKQISQARALWQDVLKLDLTVFGKAEHPQYQQDLAEAEALAN